MEWKICNCDSKCRGLYYLATGNNNQIYIQKMLDLSHDDIFQIRTSHPNSCRIGHVIEERRFASLEDAKKRALTLLEEGAKRDKANAEAILSEKEKILAAFAEFNQTPN